jgi:hypothetical protein
MIKSIINKRIVSLKLLLFYTIILQHAQAQPLNIPKGSYPEYFTYFTPGNDDFPLHADVASKGVVMLDGSVTDRVNHGTAFLIRTFRDDDQVCMCLTAHQVPDQVPIGSSFSFNKFLYQNYLGADSVVEGLEFNSTTGYSRGYLSRATLVERIDDSVNNKDIALLLINKHMLIGPYVQLGYGFDSTALWADGHSYAIGHPYGYPQRISDPLDIVNSPINTTSVNLLTTDVPYSTGPGGSGSPVLKRPENAGAPWYVRGVASTAVFAPGDILSLSEVDDYDDDQLQYSTDIEVNNISLLEQAIRKHCWKKVDSANISAGKLYKQFLAVDNPATPYSQSYTLSSASGVSTAAAANEQQGSLLASLLNANLCNISGFTLPTIYPGSTYPWVVTIAGKQVDVGTNFSYDALGNSELHLASVVIGNTVSVASKPIVKVIDLSQQETDTDTVTAGFSVYPNPSSNGIFYISFPTAYEKKGYRIVVYSIDGRQIYKAEDIIGKKPYRLELGAQSHGSYLLGIYKLQSGEKVLSQTIIY